MAARSTKPKTSKAARTRGADLDAPVNRSTIETPGFTTPKIRRRRNSPDPHQRALLLQDAYRLARAAMTDHEIATFFGIDRTRLWGWKNEDEEFRQALELGREAADDRVASSLFHKAVGYTFKSEKIVTRSLPDGGSEIVRVPVIEHVPPDNTAMIFWLKNRRPDLWRDVKDHNVSGNVQVETNDRQLALAVIALLKGAIEQGDDEPVAVIEHMSKEAAE